MMNSEDEYQAYKNDPPPGEPAKHPGGRPPYFSTLAELQKKIDEYWEYIKGDTENEDPKKRRWPERPTITGLALYLGFTTRQALINYQEKDEFVDAVKRAKLKIEAAYEQALFGNNAAGPIFGLKNFGWSDKSELDVTTGGEALSFTLNVKPDQE